MSLVSLVTTLRWGTIAGGVVWAAASGMHSSVFFSALVLVAYAMYRSFRSLDYRSHGWRGLVSILVELSLTAFVVVSTGYWDSPFIFSLFIPVIAAGFGRGFWHSLRVGITEALAVGLAADAVGIHSGLQSIDWCGELLLTAIVASYGRHLHARAERLNVLNASQLLQLNDANSLLESLNRVANDLPASFDFTETVERAMAQAQALAPSDVTAVLIFDSDGSGWTVAGVEGAVIKDTYDEASIPPGLNDAIDQKMPSVVQLNNDGLCDRSRSALYLPLWTSSRRVGALALESFDDQKYSREHVEALAAIAEPIALRIDNARWLNRLRANGATQERNRIAREIHDRLGQEMTYVALELDRLQTMAVDGELAGHIGELKSDVRMLVTELRETLQDIRTDVTENNSFVDVVGSYLERVERRSGLRIAFKASGTRRLALDLEREIWRVTQEAVVNAERHSGATAVAVSWSVDEYSAELVVRDNGGGFVHQPSDGSFGVTGMRERAQAIGAHIDIYSDESNGTTVRLTLGVVDNLTLLDGAVQHE